MSHLQCVPIFSVDFFNDYILFSFSFVDEYDPTIGINNMYLFSNQGGCNSCDKPQMISCSD